MVNKVSSERRKPPAKSAMAHYYDTGEVSLKRGDSSLPKIKTFDQNKSNGNSQRNDTSLDNGKFYEYASAKRIQKSSNIFLSKKFGDRGGSYVAKSGNTKGDFMSPESSPKKDIEGMPL